MWQLIRPWLFPVACIGCDLPGPALCSGCAPGRGDVILTVVADLGVVAAGEYAGVLRQGIVGMKRGERAYLEPFAELLASILPSDAALIPLPTSRRRRAARGFDQAVELARRTARLRGVTSYDVLEKRGSAQRGLDRLARLQADGRFRLRRDAVLPDRAIVIDDVCTTGATLADGIACLRAAGVTVLAAAVLARTSPGRNSRPPASVMASGSL